MIRRSVAVVALAFAVWSAYEGFVVTEVARLAIASGAARAD